MEPPLMTVPMAAPAVPNEGIGPRPRMNTTFSAMFIAVMTTPSRSGVFASPAARSPAPSMKNIIMPKLNTSMMRRNDNASACTAGAALIEAEQRRRREVADGRHDTDRQDHRHQERLRGRAIHRAGVAGTGETSHQHGHAGEQRPEEHHHHEEDLERHADGGIAGEPHEVADHHMVDDALQAANHFCSTVGHAIRHTAGPMGPSTMERSNAFTAARA